MCYRTFTLKVTLPLLQVRIIEKINEIERSGKKVTPSARHFSLTIMSIYPCSVLQIAQDKREMIKNVIRQLNAKIEQKQHSVAAAAQTDAAHMTRIKEVQWSPRLDSLLGVPSSPMMCLLTGSSLQNSGQRQTGRALGGEE